MLGRLGAESRRRRRWRGVRRCFDEVHERMMEKHGVARRFVDDTIEYMSYDFSLSNNQQCSLERLRKTYYEVVALLQGISRKVSLVFSFVGFQNLSQVRIASRHHNLQHRALSPLPRLERAGTAC